MSNTAENIAESIGQVIGVGLIVGAIAFGVSACSGKKEEPKAAVTPTPVAVTTPVAVKTPVVVQSPTPQSPKVITSQAQTIGVKGLDLGMDKETFTATFNKEVHGDGSAGLGDFKNKFSIAGTEGSFGNVRLTFTKEGKLGDLLFFFRPLADYDQIKEALATKYKLNCKESVVSNALRQQFDQEVCVFNNAQGDNLTLTKRMDRDTGTLTMTSKALEIQRQNEKKSVIAGAKKDI